MRTLTDYQWIILWEIDDTPNRVWTRTDRWFLGEYGDITLQVHLLLRRELIALAPAGDPNVVNVTEAGRQALEKRDYLQVLERLNRDWVRP